MVLGWFKEPAGVEDLVARRKYDRAISLLKLEFETGRRDPRLRLQLADVMVLAGRTREAVPILLGLADEFALAGAAAKAISVLKKVEKLAPGRKDVDVRLARLLKEKPADRRQAATDSVGGEFRDVTELAIGVEPVEIGGEAGPDLEVGSEVAESSSPAPAGQAEGGELLALIEDVLRRPAMPRPASEPEAGETAAVAKSPLFDDFTPEELVEVIRGLRLRSYDAGDVIVAAGEAGESLFVVASGMAKAFVPAGGRTILARTMEEGDFFGEVSVLSGGPRTATVTAATRCDLLELDRGALEAISATHPRVRDVMREFAQRRLESDRQRGEAS